MAKELVILYNYSSKKEGQLAEEDIFYKGSLIEV